MASDRIARQVERLLDDCEVAVAAGDWPRVGVLADSVLRLDPQNGDASAYLAAARVAPAVRPRMEPAERPAERRQMTVMFCDLVDSTPMAEQLDPEDLREVLHAYQETCARIIRGYEGYVAHYMGDGVLVYFGFPNAHEDDAVRAVKAALEIVREVPALGRAGSRATNLQSRVGIHYGLVVVGQMGSGTRIEPSDVVGMTANVAARLQGVAAPGAVVISGHLAQLLGQRFDLEAMGLATLKGVSDPIVTWTVRGEQRLDSTAPAREGGRAPLVGRTQELAALKQGWASAVTGRGCGAVIRGDPGIGKTRLVEELRQHTGAGPARTIDLYCSALHSGSALYPVIDFVARALLRLDVSADDLGTGAKIELLAANMGTGPDGAALLAQLLGAGGWEESPVARLSPQERKERTLELFSGFLARLARDNPVLLVVDDLQWIDPSTLELLTMTIEQAQSTAIMVVATARPDFGHRGMELPGILNILLERLDNAECEALALALGGTEHVSSELRARIVQRSDGVPLFLEELLRTMASGENMQRRVDGAAAAVQVPATLHYSLMARLDRMGSARRLAQLASTVGRAFSLELISLLAEPEIPEVRPDLDRLVEAGIVVLQDSRGRVEYRFRHALIQDVAYQSLLRSERTRLHGRIADAIESAFPQVAEQDPELLAHHLAEAQQSERAIEYLARGGRRAVARFANLEAVGLLDRALALIEGLPPSAERDRQELELRLAAGGALIAVRGYADTEVERNYARATELSSQQDRAPERFQSLWGLRRFFQVRGNFEQSVGIARQLLSAAPAINPSAVVMAEAALGDALFLTGDLPGAERHLRAASDALGERAGLSPQAIDSAIRAAAERAIVAWLRGDHAGAWPIAELAVTEARETGDKFLLCWSLSFAGWVAHLRRSPGDVATLADETFALATENSFKYFEAVGMIFRGWHAATHGGEAAIDELRRGMELYHAIGARSALTYFYLLAAEAHVAQNDTEAARIALDRGLDIGRKNDERTFVPELYRLRAEVGGTNLASADLFRSLAVAEANASPSLQLRALTALATAGLAVPGGGDVAQSIARLLDGILPSEPDADVALARGMARAAVWLDVV